MEVQNQSVAQEQASALRPKTEAPVPATQAQGVVKAEENKDSATKIDNSAASDKTSKYLKVLSRIENLLTQDALPEAAIKGFVGAVKKQLESLNELEIKEILELPEAKKLELDDIEDLPDSIGEMLLEREDIPELLNLLKQPRFATMMLSKEARNAPGTYTTDGIQSAKPKVHKEALKEALQAVEEKTLKTSQTSLTSASPNLPPAPGTSVSPV